MAPHIDTHTVPPRSGFQTEAPKFTGNPFAGASGGQPNKGAADVYAGGAPAGAPQATTQNPKSSLLVRGLKATGRAIQKPIFSYPAGQTSFAKDDFFATPKTIINKVWTWKPVWIPAGATGGAIAAGVIFGIMYKAAIIGALGAFFSSHAGWATAAAIGAVAIIAAVVYLVTYADHKTHVKASNAHKANQAIVAKKDAQLSDLHAQIAQFKEEQSNKATFRKGYERGVREATQAQNAQGVEYARFAAPNEPAADDADDVDSSSESDSGEGEHGTSPAKSDASKGSFWGLFQRNYRK